MSVPKDLTRYQKVLATSEALASFDDKSLLTLLEACEPKILNPHEALWGIGSVSEEAFILVSGKIQQTRRLQPDGQRTEHFQTPGTLLALASLVQPWEHRSVASALERTEVLRLNRAEFNRLFDANEACAYLLVDAIAENLVAEMRDANRRLHDVFGHPAETLRALRRRVRKG